MSRIETWGFTVKGEFGSATETWKSHTVAVYDGYGNCVETIEYTEAGVVSSRIARTFDSAGRVLEVYEYDSLGAVTSRGTSDYQGKVVEYRLYD